MRVRSKGLAGEKSENKKTINAFYTLCHDTPPPPPSHVSLSLSLISPKSCVCASLYLSDFFSLS